MLVPWRVLKMERFLRKIGDELRVRDMLLILTYQDRATLGCCEWSDGSLANIAFLQGRL